MDADGADPDCRSARRCRFGGRCGGRGVSLESNPVSDACVVRSCGRCGSGWLRVALGCEPRDDTRGSVVRRCAWECAHRRGPARTQAAARTDGAKDRPGMRAAVCGRSHGSKASRRDACATTKKKRGDGPPDGGIQRYGSESSHGRGPRPGIRGGRTPDSLPYRRPPHVAAPALTIPTDRRPCVLFLRRTAPSPRKVRHLRRDAPTACNRVCLIPGRRTAPDRAGPIRAAVRLNIRRTAAHYVVHLTGLQAGSTTTGRKVTG